jgi:hypothetical protein
MPVHDLVCPECGFEQPATYLPLVPLAEPDRSRGYKVTQRVDFPDCPTCRIRMAFIVPRVAMDAYEPGHEFEAEITQPDRSVKRVMVDSLSKIRQLEHDSEQRARDGEGQHLVWRDYSQDRSNRHEHAIAKDPSQKPDPAFLKRFREDNAGGPISAETADAAAYGPGVSDANTSALGDA